MKIFLLLSAIPYDHGEAIEVVSYEVVRLMAASGHEVIVQSLIREAHSSLSEEREKYASQRLGGQGRVRMMPTIFLGDLQQKPTRLQASFEHLLGVILSLPGLRRFSNRYLFPAMIAKPAIAERVRLAQADVIASIWSWEALAASYDISGVPKFVYYGNPNHKPPEAQLRFPTLFDIDDSGIHGKLKLAVLRLLNRAREIQHLRMMASCERTANNAFIDARYYTEKGHPKSIYLQNMWPDANTAPVFGGVPTDSNVQICGSVGNLGATGNTFGLYYLGAELMPRLRSRLGDRKLTVNIYGGGQARAAVRKVLLDPSIQMRGWVDDLNGEILASAAFLVLTNAYGFNVGNTRILLAWSLGSCVIAHISSALSMPELIHGENVLLGQTPEEIVDLIIRVLVDPGLRSKIGRGGYETFCKHYRSDTVVPKMLDEIEQMATEFQERNR